MTITLIVLQLASFAIVVQSFSFLSRFHNIPVTLRPTTTVEPDAELVYKLDPPKSELLVVDKEHEEFTLEIPDDLFGQIDSSPNRQSLLQLLDSIKKSKHTLLNKKKTIKSTSFNEPPPSDELKSATKDKFLENPKQAYCAPELKKLDLGLTIRVIREIFYYPSCVRILQCGGCCNDQNNLECQPMETQKVVVPVLEFTKKKRPRRTGNEVENRNRRTRRTVTTTAVRKLNVTVEEHTECSCMCKIRETECDLNIHRYNEKSCSCFCKNEDEKNKCDSLTHRWDQKSCRCICIEEFDCSTGLIFNHNKCECITSFFLTKPNWYEIDSFYKLRSASSRDDAHFAQTKKRKMGSTPLNDNGILTHQEMKY